MNNYQWYTEQWGGKPTREDDLLFLLLTVGVFQVGLSWKAAAGKKVAFMKNFCQMKPEKVAALLPDEVDRIVADPDMIRNRRKIEATIKNAQAILKVQEEFGSFANYLWQFVKNVPPVLSIYEEAYQVPRTQLLSDNVAKDLKKRGFSFVGPIVTNMFLKASGIIQVEILNPE